MRILFCRLSIIVAICVRAELSLADTVSFLQAPLAGGDGFLSDPDLDQNADDVSFAAKTKVTSVRWWGTYLAAAPEPDQFTLRFFDAGPGAPQLDPSHQFTGLSVSRSDSGLIDVAGDTIFRYEAQIPSSLVFDGGSTTYISVLNSTDDGWFWQKSSSTGSNWFRFDDLDAWDASTSGNLAFELVGMMSRSGDYNADFVVDQNDYDVWRRSFGLMDQLAADGNGNGVVDAADYVVWRDNLGNGVAAGLSLAAVPEPSSVTVAAQLVGLWVILIGSYQRFRFVLSSCTKEPPHSANQNAKRRYN